MRWRGLIGWIQGLLGLGENDTARRPSDAEIRAIARDSIEETGSGEFLRRVARAKDHEERLALKMDWEKRIAERKSSPPHL